MTATALRYRPRKRHLSLVDNINAGEAIVARAQKKNDALQVARDLGIDLEPVEVPTRRRARKPRVNRNGAVESRQYKWEDVSPAAQAMALEVLAGGDRKRLKPINRDTVVVLNHPQREPR